MTEQREIFEEMCCGYVLGSLTTEEALEFERELTVADADAQAYYRDMVHTTLNLPLTVEWVEPPPHLKLKIIQAIMPAPEPESSGLQRLIQALGFHRPAVAWSVALLFLIALGGTGYVAFEGVVLSNQRGKEVIRLGSKLKDSRQTVAKLQGEKKALQGKLKGTQKALASARLKIARQAALLRVLKDRQVRLVSMAGLGKHKQGYGKVLWSVKQKRAVLQLANLSIPKDRYYVLWFIRKAAKNSGFVPSKEAQAGRFFEIDASRIPGYRKRWRFTIGITVEKDPKVKAPTSKPIMAGKIRL